MANFFAAANEIHNCPRFFWLVGHGRNRVQSGLHRHFQKITLSVYSIYALFKLLEALSNNWIRDRERQVVRLFGSPPAARFVILAEWTECNRLAAALSKQRLESPLTGGALLADESFVISVQLHFHKIFSYAKSHKCTRSLAS